MQVLEEGCVRLPEDVNGLTPSNGMERHNGAGATLTSILGDQHYKVTMDSPDQTGTGICLDKETGVSWEIIGRALARGEGAFIVVARPPANIRAGWSEARRRREEVLWQKLTEVQRACSLKTDPSAWSKRRRLKWDYHDLVHKDVFDRRHALQREERKKWDAGARLCSVCREFIPPGEPRNISYDNGKDTVTLRARHKGCSVGVFWVDGTKDPCAVCGKRADESIPVRHRDGTNARVWLCDEHISGDLAAYLVLEQKAKDSGLPLWFGGEDEARADAVVEGDRLIVVPYEDGYRFAVKHDLSGDTWYDPASGYLHSDQDTELLRVIVMRLIDMAWYLKEEVLDLVEADVPEELRSKDGEGVFYEDDGFQIVLAGQGEVGPYRFFAKRGDKALPIDQDYWPLWNLSQRATSVLVGLIGRCTSATGESTIELLQRD